MGIIELVANSERKLMMAEEVLEALFQNDCADSDSISSSNGIHESDNDISINSDYKWRIK